jgi:muconolactone delta-isomerase
MDAVALSDIDFTGMTILGQVVDDLTKDGVSLSMARVSDKVKVTLANSFDPAVRAYSLRQRQRRGERRHYGRVVGEWRGQGVSATSSSEQLFESRR